MPAILRVGESWGLGIAAGKHEQLNYLGAILGGRQVLDYPTGLAFWLPPEIAADRWQFLPATETRDL